MANIKGNCQSFLLALTENLQKKQGKNIFETLDQYENKTLGNLKSFTLSMKLNE